MVNGASKLSAIVLESKHPIKNWLFANLQMIIHASDFLTAFVALMDSGETAAARLTGDVGMARLDAVLKASKKMDMSMTAAAKATAGMTPELSEKYSAVMFFDCQAFCTAALRNSDLEDTIELRVAGLKTTLMELCDDIAKCTKNYGNPTEESWKYCIKEDATLEEVLSIAAKTIDTVDGKEALRLSDALAEARCESVRKKSGSECTVL